MKAKVRQLFEELYSGFTLELLQSRLNRAKEEVIAAQERLDLYLIKQATIEEAIQKERNRITNYYEETAKQEFPYDYNTMNKNDEERR